MKITFENKDKNYTFSSGSNLLYLAQQHWSGLFVRESLSVFFVTEDEMKNNEALENVDDLNSTDYLGLYFSYHAEYGCDVIFICPERIKNTSENRKIDFDLLLNKVFVHELAHSLMQQNVFSVSETALYQIPSFKFFEESLCNAFALQHFSDFEKDSLTEFCKSQSPGYRHFFLWDEDALLASMNQFKLFKNKNHFLFNYLWIEKNKDVLLDERNKFSNEDYRGGVFCFVDVSIISDNKCLSIEIEKTKGIIDNIFKLKSIKSLGFDEIKKSRGIILATVNQMGYSFTARLDVNEGCQNAFLLYKQESAFVRFFCLNKNDFSIFVVEKEWLDNLISYPFHGLVISSKLAVEKSVPKMNGGRYIINFGQIKVGMTMNEVLSIVGENNLLEAAKYFKPRFVGSDKIMTFNSGGDPTGCILGFKDNIVNRIIKFSTSD